MKHTARMAASESHAQLQLKVVPSSSRDAIAGWVGEALKVKVQAPPERGKANRSVVRLLAKALDLPESALEISSGETSPHKQVRITGLSQTELTQRIAKLS